MTRDSIYDGRVQPLRALAVTILAWTALAAVLPAQGS